MQIEIEYSTQVRAATGVTRQKVEIGDECLATLLKQLVTLHPGLTTWISPNGQPRPGLLVFINDKAPTELEGVRLQPDDCVALMTLVSGG